MKGKRCPNFTNAEKAALIEITGRYKAIIDNKMNDTTSLQRKSEAWINITRDFQAESGPRDMTSLRHLYCNIKRNAKKELAEKQPLAIRTDLFPTLFKIENESDESNESEIKRPRNRSSKFTQEEELNLALEIEKFKDIIECKMTDKITNAEKNEAWIKIESAFNTKSKTQRTIQQLKFKYDHFKMKAKKTIADPSSINTNKDPVMDVVLRIINKSHIIDFDTSRDPLTLNECVSENSVENSVWDEEELDIKDTEITITNNNGTSEDIIIEPEKLQRLVDNNVQLGSIIPAENKTLKKNWSTLEYRKPKPPISKKLRHITSRQSMMDDYYRKKTELMCEQIKKTVLEREEILRKRKRDEEEHEKKMIILDLDIKLKQEMLSEQ
ncbi:uncharacterized protein [Onthophagus taurus]|uniref:uncharacterized protein n=1 Tax=Onthophagus taurus TaxID=166361 RepID=UPI0039BE4F84